jgi:predicted ATPase
MLVYDSESGSWRWDAERIAEQRVAESVVELLVEKLLRLPETARGLLHMASCMGNRFDLGLLTILSGQSVLQVVRGLRPSMDEGIIRTICPGYGRVVTWSESDCDCTPQQVMGVYGEFNHNRIHQAVYARIPERKRRKVHLRLGRWLRSNLDGRSMEERLFEVVNHFHVAGDELIEPDERRAIAELNHDAGLKARRAGARDAARKYFSKGIDLLPEDRWQSCHRLTFDLLVGLYDCILLNEQDAEQGLAIGEELLAHAATRIERMIALSLHVIQLSMRGRQPEHALELGLEALREAGIELDPPDPGRVVAQGYRELNEKLAGRRISGRSCCDDRSRADGGDGARQEPDRLPHLHAPAGSDPPGHAGGGSLFPREWKQPGQRRILRGVGDGGGAHLQGFRGRVSIRSAWSGCCREDGDQQHGDSYHRRGLYRLAV